MSTADACIVGASERIQLIRLPIISFAPASAGSVGNHRTDIESINFADLKQARQYP